MNHTRHKLLTLVSALLLTLFAGCANQNAQETPPEPDAPTVLSGKWPSVDRNLETLDGSPVTEAHFTQLQGDIISQGYNPFSEENDLADVNERLAPLGLQIVEEALEAPTDVTTIRESGEGNLSLTQARCPRTINANANFEREFFIPPGNQYFDRYRTNSNGYPLSASYSVTRLRANYREGGEVYCSTASVGAFGGSIGRYPYQGGHMVANRFGGPAARFNLFPQVGRFNGGSFRRIEGIIAENARRLGEANTIRTTVALEYGGDNIVPYGMNVEIEVFKNNALSATRSWYYSNQNPDKRNRSGKTNYDYNVEQKNSIEYWLARQ